MNIRPASQFDFEFWLKCRKALFPSKTESQHVLDVQQYLYYSDFKQAFLAELNAKPIGLIEVVIKDSVEGSTLAPVAVCEAWYVEAEQRQKGIGKALMLAAEQWAKSKKCKQIGSWSSNESAYLQLAFEHTGYRKIVSIDHYLKTLKLTDAELADPVGVVLETNRLIVREAQFKDIDTIVEYLNTNKVFHAPYEAPRPHNYYTKSYWQERIYSNYYRLEEDKSFQLFIFLKDDPDKTIGYTNYYNTMYGAFYSCHVGYMMAESAQGHGYMKEALKAGIQYLFKTKNLHRIQANYMPKNKRSGKTLQSLGFEIEGKAKNFLFVNGKWEDHLLTSLTNTEW